MTNLYLQLLLEAIHKASIIPFGQDTAFWAMRAFGHDMAAPIILSIIGGIMGNIFNWYIGRTLAYAEHKGKLHVNPHIYEKTRAFAEKYGIYLLFFAWAPLGNFLAVAAGFLKLPLKKVMLLVAIGLALHYGV